MQLIMVRTCVKPVFEWGIISTFCPLQIRTVKGLISVFLILNGFSSVLTLDWFSSNQF